ncbi:hypothetical protein AMS68_007443 [Peltaster fructicola]|uniref:Apple domain-containing protein n=1 Tax=Peltaster fructicola TaxID=286661 RepID=A0A6H0Y4N4_9PEZI|nr:hypothetical protein AMS68_007443 [Peltaster fructicola]
MRSILAPALCLSLVHQSVAYIPHSLKQVAERDVELEQSGSILSWFSQLFKRSSSNGRRQNVCYEDDYYNFVSNATFGQAFCQAYLDYPDTTTTLDGTSTTTLRTIISTQFITRTDLIRATPVSTVTVTVSPPLAKRDSAVVAQGFAQFEALAAAAGSPVDAADLSASFSSACACQTYGGATVTETAAVVTKTLAGFVRSTTTLTTTQTVNAGVTTVTVTTPLPVTALPVSTHVGVSLPVVAPPPSIQVSAPQQPSAVAPVSASPIVGTPASPTGLSFSCPGANGTTVSQLVDNERFDYLIMCDYDYPKEDTFYAELAYNSFAECAAACSMADAYFDNSFCQVAVYYPNANADGFNCLLKPATQTGVSTPGVNAAVLQLIALGVGSAAPSGTGTTLPGGFAPQSSSIPVSVASSSVSSLMGNGSSTSLPIITPAPVVPVGRAAQAFTAFTTYVSDGTTYSTGSEFSTYFSGNGSWYSIYYNTWSLAWAAATTVVGIGSDSSEVAQTNSTTYSTTHNGDGTYVQVTNTTVISYTYYPTETVANSTDTIVYSTFASNGTFLTASTTVIYGIATSSNGGTYFSTGGSGGAATTPPDVSAFSTVFVSTSITANGNSGSVILLSGATSGGVFFSTGGVASPSSTQTVISSTTVDSSVTSTAPAASTGVVPPVSVIVNSGFSSGGTFFSTNGVIPQPSSTPIAIAVPPVSIIVSSGSTTGGTYTAASGVIPPASSSSTDTIPGLPSTISQYVPPVVTTSVSGSLVTTTLSSTMSDVSSASAASSSDDYCNPDLYFCYTTNGLRTRVPISSTAPVTIPGLPSTAVVYTPPILTTSISGSLVTSVLSLPSSDISSASSASSDDYCNPALYFCYTTNGLRTRVPISSIPVSTGSLPLSTPASSGTGPLSSPAPSSGASQSVPESSASPSSSPSGTVLSPATNLPSSSIPSGSAPVSSATSSGAESSPVPTPSIPVYPGGGYVPPAPPSSSDSTSSDYCDGILFDCITLSNGLRTRIPHTSTPVSISGSLPIIPASLSSLLIPTGTGSLPVIPTGTGSLPIATPSLPPSFSLPLPSGSMSGSLPIPSESFPDSGLPRSGPPFTSSGAVPPVTDIPPPLTTGPVTALPSSFAGYNCSQATTTVFTTVTLFGCYSNCPSNAAYTPGLTAFGEVPPT